MEGDHFSLLSLPRIELGTFRCKTIR